MSLLDGDAGLVAEIEAQLRAIELVEEDGENMESDWHRLAMTLLIEAIAYFLRDRTDFYVGGNMFIYFNEEVTLKRNFRGPDFFFVWGVSREPLRRYWLTYREGGHNPDVIIELLSPTTAHEDLTTKKDVYERVFHTHEYFCYDPERRVLKGWRLIDHRYEPIQADQRGWLWCEELGLWLGTWQGTFQNRHALWLRFFDSEGQVVATFAEAAQQQAEAERQQAEAARQQAEAERKRAEAAETELARLKAQLAQQGNTSGGKEESAAS